MHGSLCRFEQPASFLIAKTLNDLVHHLYPNKFVIAEDLDNSSRLNDTAGFDSQWDVAFFETVYRAIVTESDQNRDMSALSHVIAKSFSGRSADRIIYTGLRVFIFLLII